uniref:ANK_REP_REGION domain-containing protein n=1 Tax=Anopheles melas TaxID=34690 RepID=A0A182TSU5_9DIPT
MEVGPSPPAEGAPNLYDSYDESYSESSAQLCNDIIRISLTEQMRLAAHGSNVNALERNGTNPIHLAADLGHTQCLAALLECPNADPNIRIQQGDKQMTALHLAADEGNLDCVTQLLARGADVRARNHRGFTPLHLAARSGSADCVEALLKLGGCDPNMADFDQPRTQYMFSLKCLLMS